VPESAIEAERDAWILVAARYPDQITAFMPNGARAPHHRGQHPGSRLPIYPTTARRSAVHHPRRWPVQCLRQPELVTLASNTATQSTWRVDSGGRIGFVVGEDTVEGGCTPQRIG
jgi:hypothetical protein